jgi:hypothetical protein
VSAVLKLVAAEFTANFDAGAFDLLGALYRSLPLSKPFRY